MSPKHNSTTTAMSNHLLRIWISAIRTLSRTIPSLSRKEVVDNVGWFALGTGVHAAYAFFTEDTKEIQVAKKYTMVRHGFTDFMIVDTRGRHYNVNNSLWYWKWDSVEEWTTLTEGETRRVRMYGWRKPLLGLFPNIVSVSNNSEGHLNTPSMD